MNELDVIHNWRYRADRVQQAHYLAGRRYERFHRYIGVPTSIFMAIVGTAIFANISDKQATLSVELQLLVGFISVLSSILSGLQTFLGFSELSEKHRIAGARYANLKQQLELLECYQGADMLEHLGQIESSWAKLREESPNLPQTVWQKIRNQLSYQEHANKYQRIKA